MEQLELRKEEIQQMKEREMIENLRKINELEMQNTLVLQDKKI